MSDYIADIAVKKMVEAGQSPKNSNVAILGLTFKENCNDIRNSKVASIIKRLKEYGINPFVTDTLAEKDEVLREYGIELTPLNELKNIDCIIVAVAHDSFKRLSFDDINKLFRVCDNSCKVLIDVKGIFEINKLNEMGFTWWRL